MQSCTPAKASDFKDNTFINMSTTVRPFIKIIVTHSIYAGMLLFHTQDLFCTQEIQRSACY